MHAGGVIQGIYINRQVHEVYIVRTPILQLPPCKLYLIRRKMHSVWCEYIISLIQSSLDSVSSRRPRFHLAFLNGK